MACTIRDVAREAGVAPGTVSLALRKDSSVTLETAARIEAAAKALGFKARRYRRRGAGGGVRSHTLALLMCQLPMELLKVPLFAALFQALEAKCRAEDLQLSVVHCDGEGSLPRWLTPGRVDGALVFGPAPLQHRGQIEELRPVILLAAPLEGEEPWADCVSFDYGQRGCLAARYLLDKGHERIGFVCPRADHPGWNTVAGSFQKYAQAKGVEPFMMISERGYEGHVWHSSSGRPIIRELVDRWQREPAARRPTGIYVVLDEVTEVLYQELEARQIKVGRDVEILSTGHESPELCSREPQPATLDLNVEDLALRAIEKVLFRINNPDAHFGATTWIPARLVEARGGSHRCETSVKNEQESL